MNEVKTDCVVLESLCPYATKSFEPRVEYVTKLSVLRHRTTTTDGGVRTGRHLTWVSGKLLLAATCMRLLMKLQTGV